MAKQADSLLLFRSLSGSLVLTPDPARSGIPGQPEATPRR